MTDFIKSVWLLIKMSALTVAAVYFYLNPGTVLIEWQDTAIDLSMAMFVFLLVIVVCAGAVIYHLWRRLIDLPQIVRDYNRIKNINKGYKAVTKGLLAVAAGDEDVADDETRRAEKLLPDRALTKLLIAQTASLKGEDLKAQKSYQALLDDPEVSFFGVRGLLTKALNDNDLKRALTMAREAYEQQPRRPWVLETLFDLEARTEHWAEARKVLFKMEKYTDIASDVSQNNHAVLLTAEAKELLGSKENKDALKRVVKAYKYDPEFVPAYVVATKALMAEDKKRQAKKTVLTGWENAPHPDLYDLWCQLGPTHPLERMEWVEKLVAVNPNRYQSHIAMTKSALEANLWGVARTHLQYAEATEPRQGTYKLLAKLERMEGKNPDKETEWLEKAANAGPDKTWICRQTGDTFNTWHPIQPVTKEFNTIIWDVPRYRQLTPVNS